MPMQVLTRSNDKNQKKPCDNTGLGDQTIVTVCPGLTKTSVTNMMIIFLTCATLITGVSANKQNVKSEHLIFYLINLLIK